MSCDLEGGALRDSLRRLREDVIRWDDNYRSNSMKETRVIDCNTRTNVVRLLYWEEMVERIGYQR